MHISVFLPGPCQSLVCSLEMWHALTMFSFQFLDCGMKTQILALPLVRDTASCCLRLVPQPPGHQLTDQSVPALPKALLEFHTMGVMSWQRLTEQGKKEAPLFQT